MKIVAVPANHHGSGYHRVLVPLRALAARGYTVDLLVDVDDQAQLADADVVVLPLAQNEKMYRLAVAHRAGGGRVIYEIDDDYRATPLTNPARRMRGFAEHVAWMNRTIGAADALIVPTPVLAEAYRDLCARSFVCPNALDPADVSRFFQLGEPPDDGEVRIVLAGSESHYYDISSIVAPLTRVFDAHPNLRLIVLGADFRRLFPLRVRERARFLGHTFYTDDGGMVREFCFPGEPWPVLRYYDALAEQRPHVGVAPLVDDAFNRAKSHLKLIEYGALGIPTLASAVAPYRDYVRTAGPEAVLLASDAAQWESALTALVTSAELRDRLRRMNRAHVLDHHLIHHRVAAWQQAVDAVVNAEVSGGAPSSSRD